MRQCVVEVITSPLPTGQILKLTIHGIVMLLFLKYCSTTHWILRSGTMLKVYVPVIPPTSVLLLLLKVLVRIFLSGVTDILTQHMRLQAA